MKGYVGPKQFKSLPGRGNGVSLANQGVGGAGVGGALVEQMEDFGIDGVDGLTVGGEGLVGHGAVFVRDGDGLIV